jgi:hypothetical protein
MNSSSTSCPACKAEKDRSKAYCRTCEDALITIASLGDDDLFEDDNVKDNNVQQPSNKLPSETAPCVTNTKKRNGDTRPENNLVTPEGSQENNGRKNSAAAAAVATLQSSTQIRRRLHFLEPEASSRNNHICPACNGEKDEKSKKLCRGCEDTLAAIALKGVDDDDDAFVGENEHDSSKNNEKPLAGTSVSQNATTTTAAQRQVRQLQGSDSAVVAANNHDDSSSYLVLTLQIRSHAGTSADRLQQRFIAAKKSGQVLEIRSTSQAESSTSSSSSRADTGGCISCPCVITAVDWKRGGSQSSYTLPPPWSNNNSQQSDTPTRTMGSSSTCSATTTNVDLQNSSQNRKNATSLISNRPESSSSEAAAAVATTKTKCIDCGVPTDQIWMRRCNACYSKNMDKLRQQSSSGGAGLCQCRMCSKQLDETWKRYCGVCYAAKQRDEQRNKELPANESLKRNGVPQSSPPEAKRSRIQN